MGILVGRGSLPRILPPEESALVAETGPPPIIVTEPEAPPKPSTPPPTLDFYKELSEKAKEPSAPPTTAAKPAPKPVPKPSPKPEEPKPEEKAAQKPAPAAKTADKKKPSPAKETAASAEARYSLQAAAFRNRAEAKAYALKISKQTGFDFKVVTAEIKDKGTWHRVRTGAYSTRAEAKSRAQELESKGVKPMVVSLRP